MEYKIAHYKGIRYIIIPELVDLGLNHCFTTGDLNMRIGSDIRKNGDISNYHNTFDFLDIKPREVFICNQQHTDNVFSIDDLNIGERFILGKIIDKTDGLVTDLEDVSLVTNYADCSPIILFDRTNRVHANIHSGWRGTLQEIVTQGIKEMKDKYNSNPDDILVVLGPSIGRDDFEVDEDVMLLFKDKFASYDNIIRKKDGGKYLIDLNRINISTLIENGIPEDNITIINLSTFSNPLFHSYRRDNINYELMALITCL